MKTKLILLAIGLTSLTACTSDQRDEEIIQPEAKKEMKKSLFKKPDHYNNDASKKEAKDTIFIHSLKEDLKSETETPEIITPGDVKPPKGK